MFVIVINGFVLSALLNIADFWQGKLEELKMHALENNSWFLDIFLQKLEKIGRGKRNKKIPGLSVKDLITSEPGENVPLFPWRAKWSKVYPSHCYKFK